MMIMTEITNRVAKIHIRNLNNRLHQFSLKSYMSTINLLMSCVCLLAIELNIVLYINFNENSNTYPNIKFRPAPILLEC